MAVQRGLSRVDYFWLGAIPVLSAWMCLAVKAPYLISIFLFYGVPALYLALRRGDARQILIDLVFTGTVAMPFAIVVDYIGTLSRAWYVPNTLFPDRFLGLLPWEDFVWMFLVTYCIVSVYGMSYGNGKSELVGRRMAYFILFAILGLGAFFGILGLGRKAILAWPTQYAYVCLGCIFFLVPAIVSWWRPFKLLRHFFPLVLYFLYLTLIFEIIASILGLWLFPGPYFFSPFSLFGLRPIPYEELFFVGIVGPLVAIGFYRYCSKNLG
jgi:hypothetical protein